MMELKKTISKHFRILCIFVLLLPIAFLSLSFHYEDENLPFKTYVFSINGTGTMSNVRIMFDFKNGTHGMLADVSPGDYSLRSSTGAAVMVGGKEACNATNSVSACSFAASEKSGLAVLFNTSQMIPNGRFRLSFPSKTDAVVKIVLGENYVYKDLLSLLPRDVHGHYAPEDDVVLIQTVSDLVGDEGKTDFIDFDLYALDERAHETNTENDWRQDIIIAPLVVAFLLLLISDGIDYAHNYLQDKYAKEAKK